VKVGIYARVSTSEEVDRQKPEVQLLKLREFVKSRGCEVYNGYVDRASRADLNRPALDQMMNDARAHRFDAIIIVRLDRITRSLINLLNILEHLEAYNVKLICTDQPIDTNTPAGRLIIHVLAALAEFEREFIRDRVRDGMRKAALEGRHLGRPERAVDTRRAAELRAEGKVLPYREIAEELGLPEATLRRRVKRRP
jgi:putative DNA-invertase from lambdoid prophage Rac